MPSHLVPMNEDIFDRWVADAEESRQAIQIPIRSPWAGLTSDLDPYQSPLTAMSDNSVGLVARPGPGGVGEVLMPDAGFLKIDGNNLPLTTDNVPAGTSGNTAISMLAQFNRTTAAGAKTSGTEYDGPTMLALVAGDGINEGSSELWRVKPSDGTWERVTYETVTGTPDSTLEPKATREATPDWAEFPAGAPARGTNYSGNIDEPVFVWCGLTPEGIGDNVMVYPNDDTTPENSQYEPLNEDSFNGTFKAKTVEHFGGRLYFGNTIEDSTQYRQRVRRTALFTADPDPTSPGAGAFDIRDFSGDLLRLEKLGDLLVAYFTDGTAFIRLSDVATAPDRVQLLRERRGLLATHAVCSVGNQEHFGIFDDGWYILDPSGRWTEVGMANIDGVNTPKWKETFYSLIDMDYRHQLAVNYDGRFIRIAFTTVGNTENNEVWIFDPRGNRVFRDSYPVTCWGEANANIQEAVGWDDLVGSWSDLNATWLSWAAKFSIKNLNHGTAAGYVVRHDYDVITRIDATNGSTQNPSYTYSGVLSSVGDPTELKTALKLWVEYINTGEGTMTLTVEGNSGDGSETGMVDFNEDSISGDIDLLFKNFNFSATNLRFTLNGSSPVIIRSILADITKKSQQIGDSSYTPPPTGGGGGRR